MHEKTLLYIFFKFKNVSFTTYSHERIVVVYFPTLECCISKKFNQFSSVPFPVNLRGHGAMVTITNRH